MNKEEIQIGKFTILRDEAGLWIVCEDGEGGTFSEDEVEKVIAEYYEENF